MCLQIDLVKGMMDCLYAECKPCITDCVMAELEKLGQKYRVALKVAKASRACCLLCHLKNSKEQHCRMLLWVGQQPWLLFVTNEYTAQLQSLRTPPVVQPASALSPITLPCPC
jgi:hypothetical protein